MDVKTLSANRLYSSARQAAQPGAPDGQFSQNLGKAAQDFVSTLREGEKTAMQAMQGQASIPDLAESMARSALAIESAVTVRDKVVEAYQEILRMPV